MNHPRAVTRQAVLIAHADEMRTRTGLSHEEWAERVDTSYCQRIAEKHRRLSAPDLASLSDAIREFSDVTRTAAVPNDERLTREIDEAIAALEGLRIRAQGGGAETRLSLRQVGNR